MHGARPGIRSIFGLGAAGRHRCIAFIGHGMVARPAMTAAAAMQREAVRRTVVAILAGLIVLPIRTVRSTGPLGPLRPLPLLRRRLRLAAGDEGRQPFDVFVIGRLEVLVPGLVVLLRVLLRLLMVLRLLIVRRLVLLRLLLLARIVGLLLRRERLATHGRLVVVAVV